MIRLRPLTPFLLNLAIAAAARLILPVTLADGGERYLYYMMSLFFPYASCPSFHCFRFVPPLLVSLLPLQIVDAFIVTGVLCQVAAGTLLWHIAGRLGGSRQVAFLATALFWTFWGPLPALRDPMLIADPVQALWVIAGLFLLIERRYAAALPVLVVGAGVKESVVLVPCVYAAFLILSGESVRGRLLWIAGLIGAPLLAWALARRGLIASFDYLPAGAASTSGPVVPNTGLAVLWPTIGYWFSLLGPWPHNAVIAALYVFTAFGAGWIFGILGLASANRRQRALVAAASPAILFLCMYQEPHRAITSYPFAMAIPAALYLAPLPAPLVAAVLVVNAAFTLRMSATVSWLPRMPILMALLLALTACCVWWRWRDARSPRNDHHGRVTPATPESPGGWWTATSVVAVAVLLIGVIGRDLLAARSAMPSTLAVPPSGMIAVDEAGAPGLALAPDETRIVFTGSRGDPGARQLWLTSIGSTASEPIPGTENATAPFWSPDGRAVGFFAGGQLKRIDLGSGSVRVLADAPASHGGTWSPRGTILFAAGSESPIQQVPDAGGPATPATAFDRAQPRASHRWPQILPDGEHFLFTEVGPALGEGALRLGTIGSRESRRLLKDAYGGFYVKPGLVFFARENAVRVQPFDLRRRTMFPTDHATSLPIAASSAFSRIAMTATARAMAFAGPDASRADAPAPAQARWYDRAGRPIDRAADPDAIGRVESPDGRQIALTVRPTDTGLWEIRAQPAGGGAGRTLVANLPAATTPTSWSADGRILLYQTVYGDAPGVWAVPIAGGPPERLFRDAPLATQAQFSPDGKWIAYSAVDRKRGDVRQVYVEPYPPTGDRWTVSPDAGDQPRWRGDGREIAFVVSNRLMTATTVDTRGGFHMDGPRTLFETRVARVVDGRYQYAMAPDGQRFLVNAVTGPVPAVSVTVMTNWTRALRLVDK
ncbi:MAG: PD40 domain-containing protein [Acidobacteria bacterium]|nr:PD40 domain-containing protein [Acidobacteriota bacterium]